jgi:hypothetical protein
MKRVKSPVFQSSTKLSPAEPHFIAIQKNIKFRKEVASNKNTSLAFFVKSLKKRIQIKILGKMFFWLY